MPTHQDRPVAAPTANPFGARSRALGWLAASAAIGMLAAAIAGFIYVGADAAVYPFGERTPRPTPAVPIPLQGQDAPARAPARVTARRAERHDDECQLVAPPPVALSRQAVYRWVDSQGTTHFADRAPDPGQGVSATLDRVITKREPFSIEVRGDKARVPALLHDRIHQSARRIYQVLAAPLTPAEIRKAEIRINLIADRRTFLDAYGQQQPGQLTPHGFYTSATHQAYVLIEGSPAQIQATAIHESAHLILTTLYQRTPLWLNEGLAEYFEVLPTSVIHNQYQPNPEWLNSLRRHGPLPLERLFAITPEQWRAMPPERSYANAWALVYFLMNSDAGRTALQQLLRAIKATPCAPLSSAAVLNAAYPGGLARLRDDWRRWLRSA